MTVSSSLNRKAYTGDGVTTSFSTSPVVFYDSDELDVYVVTTATGASTTLTENTHYTVSGGAGSTGTVNLAGGSSPYGAPSASQTLVIVRTLDLVQEFDPQNNDGSDADNIERAFDKLTMMAQQNAAAIARSFKLADSDVSGASTEVPTPSASKLIGWNSAGTALENKAAADVDLTAVTAYTQTLLDDADAATAQATLLLGTKSTVACAATTADIWTGTGTLIDFTGSTGPVTDFPDAPRAGIQRVLLCASTPTFNHGANLIVPGGANYTAAAGDIIIVTAETTTKFRLSIFKADGTAVVVAAATTPLPRSYLAGCTLSNNGSDATNDIDIAAGVCRDSTNAANITVAALTKRLDANWAAGTNQGMRYSGAAITDTTYGIWAVAKAAGADVDIYAYPNSGAPSAATVLAALQAETGGADYLYVRRIGCILRESAAIVAFSQMGDEFLRSASVLDVNASNPGTSAVTRTLSVPLGVKVHALLRAGVLNAASGVTSAPLLSEMDRADEAPSSTAAPLLDTGGLAAAAGWQSYEYNAMRIRTNTSAQVRSRLLASDANCTLRIATYGWIDARGRDD